MPPKNRANEGILGSKGGGNWGPPKRHLGKKKAGKVVNGVQRPARYPAGRLAMAEIIKYRRDGGYLIPKAPFYRLCQEIVSNLPLQQRLRWQRSAVECLQVAAEEHLVMNMAAGALGAAHAGRVTLMVSDLRLVDDVLNVMAGKPDRATREEQRRHENAPAGPANPPPNNDDDDDDQPRPSGRRRLLSAARDAGGNGGDDGDDGDDGDGGGNDGGGNGGGNDGDADGDGDEDGDGDGGGGRDGGRDGDGGGDGGVEALPRGRGGPSGARGLTRGGGNNTPRRTTGRRSTNTTPLRPTRGRGWSAGGPWSG